LHLEYKSASAVTVIRARLPACSRETHGTARLIMRFRRPVVIEHSAVVRAWLRENEPPFLIEAEFAQDGRVLVRAAAKFIKREEGNHGFEPILRQP